MGQNESDKERRTILKNKLLGANVRVHEMSRVVKRDIIEWNSPLEGDVVHEPAPLPAGFAPEDFVYDDLRINTMEVVQLCVEAGEAQMDIYNDLYYKNIWKQVGVEKKDGSPFTIADACADKIIKEKLTELYSNIPIMSEEDKTRKSADERSKR